MAGSFTPFAASATHAGVGGFGYIYQLPCSTAYPHDCAPLTATFFAQCSRPPVCTQPPLAIPAITTPADSLHAGPAAATCAVISAGGFPVDTHGIPAVSTCAVLSAGGFSADVGLAAAITLAYALCETALTLAHAVLVARDFPLAAGGPPAGTRLPHVVLAACGVPTAMGGVPTQALHAVPTARGLPSAVGGLPAAT